MYEREGVYMFHGKQFYVSVILGGHKKANRPASIDAGLIAFLCPRQD